MKKALLLLIILFTLNLLPHVHAVFNTDIPKQGTYIDNLGYGHFIGVVKNNDNVWLDSVKVTTVLHAKDGTTLDVLTTYTLPSHIPPGGSAAFNNVEIDPDRAKAVASATSVVSADQSGPLPAQLTIKESTSSMDSLGYLEIVGTVRNAGPQPSSFTKVVGIFYDTQGNITYVALTSTNPETIPANTEYGFKLIVENTAQSSASKSVTLLAESDQYSSVPEFPLATIALLTALTLGVVIRKGRKGKW